MRRRLNLLILGHLWALVPVGVVWFLAPAERDILAPAQVRALSILGGITIGYLTLRTWRALTSQRQSFTNVWPYIDVTLVTAALGISRNPQDPIAMLYFIPLASAVASLSITLLAVLAIFATLQYLVVVVLSGVPWSVAMVFRLVIIAVVASLYGWLIRAVTDYERAAERAEFQTALAREIHDGIQFHLVTLARRLDLAHRIIAETPDRAAEIIVAERETARRAADELRYLVRRLRMAPQQQDLALALRHQVAALAERWPFILEVDVPPRLPRLAPAAEHALLRVIQESLTNVAKHAQAVRAEVRLSAADRSLRCTIHDDGAGFDPSRAEGAGLEGLRERVRSAGGTLQIDSAPGQGTTVEALFPLPESRSWRRFAF